MDNKAAFYKAQYEIAAGLAQDGKQIAALDICWRLRLAPELSLYRRAKLNLLIAVTADIREHPDKAKFAEECIDLIGQVRRNFPTGASKESVEELREVERRAQKALGAIREERMLSDALALGGAKGEANYKELLDKFDRGEKVNMDNEGEGDVIMGGTEATGEATSSETGAPGALATEGGARGRRT